MTFKNVSYMGMNNFHLLSSDNGKGRPELEPKLTPLMKNHVFFTLGMSDF